MPPRIDWEMITDGYNDKFGTEFTVREMLEKVYTKERSILRMEPVIGVEQYTIKREMVRRGITIQPKGHPRPTILDRFKLLTDQEVERHTNQEIADMIGCTASKSVAYYRYLRKNNYEYGNRI